MAGIQMKAVVNVPFTAWYATQTQNISLLGFVNFLILAIIVYP